MNVQELIEKLKKVKDKTQKVHTFNESEEVVELEDVWIWNKSKGDEQDGILL